MLTRRGALFVASSALVVSCGQDDGDDATASLGGRAQGGAPLSLGGRAARGGASGSARGGVSSSVGGSAPSGGESPGLDGTAGEAASTGGAASGGSASSVTTGGRAPSAQGGGSSGVLEGGKPNAAGGARSTSPEGGAGGEGGAGPANGGFGAVAGSGGEAGEAPNGGAAGFGANGGTSGMPSSGGTAGASPSAGTGGTAASAGSAGVAGMGGLSSAPGPSVLTRSYNRARTGSNLAETILSPATFREHAFGKLFCKPVDDEIYAQLLYLGGLEVGGRVRNVVFVATMNDSVYAFDADDADPAPLWHVNYTDPDHGVTPVPTADLGGGMCPKYKDISHQVGITSTPAIDASSGTMYFVARTKESGSYVQRLHAIDVRTGAPRAGSPVIIQASAAGTGVASQGGIVKLDPKLNNQRMAVTLVDKSIYLGFASHCDTGAYHGWVLRYDADTLAQTGVFTTTPNGEKGGVWMSGAAPAVDDAGNLYLTVGNGTSDTESGGNDYSQSFLELTANTSGIQVSDWFTPWNYVRTNGQDLDVGSSGPILIPNSNLLLGGGKEGRLYLLNRQKLGNFDPTGKQVYQEFFLNGARGRTHIHGAPVYWKSTNGEFLYIMSEEDHVRQFRLENNQLKVVHTSEVRAPIEEVTVSGTTMPGGILSLSAAGDRAGSGLVWVNINSTGDANQAVVPGVLRVFDADDVTKELWNSDASARDAFGEFAKFNPPTVTGGKVYVPTFSGQFCAYGVLSP